MVGLVALSLVAGSQVAQAVPFTAVHLEDKFWAPRLEVNRTVTIPYAFRMDEETGRMRNFDNAAATLRGEDPTGKPLPGYPFDDTDVYKVLEGAAYSLSVHPDPKLDAYLDALIAKIAAAQEPDGYIYTARTINPAHPHDWSGKERWVNEEEQSHELYDLGHLYEAAAAHYQATGKRTLLNVAIKSADLLDRTFGPGKRKIWPGHEIVEMGLARLYRATREERYLRLAKFFLDCRGDKRDGQYWQADRPVVDQSEAEGHAVRASYLYSGMADVAALTGDRSYADAIERIWNNVVDKKLYITGGIGATASGEAFGANYELPNRTAYCETCAAVGNDFWNERLFFLHPDAKYIDVLERTLYNGLLSGVGLDGKSFFYPNPLESRGNQKRSAWFGCACCPGNITRFLPSIPGYFYATAGHRVYVNLFATSTATINGKLVITQKTNYPWDGDVKMTLTSAQPSASGSPQPSTQASPFKGRGGLDAVSLRIRIPGWARNEVVPSDLYTYKNPSKEVPMLRVNGKRSAIRLEDGYAVLDRTWKSGDVVELHLPMPVREVRANTNVAADRNRVALERGPIVFCAEGVDNQAGHVRNLGLLGHETLEAHFEPNRLGGIEEITGKAWAARFLADGSMTMHEQDFVAIPYYAWANRGPSEMTVWFPDQVESMAPLPVPTLAGEARVVTSGGTNPSAINDSTVPTSSGDENSFFHWWPKKGTTEWVEYTFKKPETISKSSVYWFDDTGWGECRVPESWQLEYKDGDTWKPVEATSAFGVAKDRYNEVAFKPVVTTAMRLRVKLQSGWSAGIHQWQVK